MTTRIAVAGAAGRMGRTIIEAIQHDGRAELAAFVDEKMRLAARECPQGDTLKTAVLAAINIADEFFRVRDDAADQHASLRTRAGELERMLDLALGLDEPRAAVR